MRVPAIGSLLGVPEKWSKRASWIRIWIACLFLFVLASGCPQALQNKSAKATKTAKVFKEPVELNVWAAASLKDVLQALAPGFEKREKAKLVFNFAASGDLQVQIEQGAPADIFISASMKQMDALEKEGLIDKSSRSNLLGNELVIVVPIASAASLTSVGGLRDAPGLDKIAIGDPQVVPAGKYARMTLETGGLWEALQSRLVLAKDVRQVLSYVETGNVDAGFVYRSDAQASKKTRIILRVPGSYHDSIVYPVAVVTGGKHSKLAVRFEGYLKSKSAGKVFKEFGFTPLAAGY
ncbi:MAG: molybdate ABC transporter substrate-binding protein [Actinobacteria bacterium]|nr:molybdate ABC transporter substrate-binding protein [Actinomycetota bacterium]